ncbi:sensor histidine kinase [Emergencia sp.]|uniref:sensor histidine kinase n=1 Tax=Emergencia sp. TaxID=1926557 RepID=UPI003AEFB134
MTTIILFTAAGLLFLAAVGIIAYTRHSLIMYTKKLSDCLDSMIAGDEEIAFEEEEDSLVGKVQVKMRKLYEILQSRTEDSQRNQKNLEKTISDLSHQVKTPIASIRMYQNILMRQGINEEDRMEFLRNAEKQVDKLEFLIQAMIKMSRLETGIVNVSPKLESVYQLVEAAVCDVALKAEAKNIGISVDCKETLFAYFDKKWTTEALFNIIDNAVKYTKEGGEIRISASATDFFIRIQVRDNGRGIEESHITEIFKRFYREPSAAEVEGVGIGLYLAREIITKEKGFIEVRSKIGIGSLFSLNLPIEP